MAEPEPHIRASIDAMSDAELRPLAAALLQHAVMDLGPANARILFPVLEKHWREPQMAGWPPQVMG
jgi:hypothetical protein